MEFGTYVQVISFFDRKIYTWCFLALGILGSTYVAFFIQASPALAIYIWVACWFLSVFTLMPAEIPENNNLVILSGALIILIAVASRWANSNCTTFWLYLTRANKRDSQSSKLYFVQVILVAISSIMVWLSTSHRSQNRELHSLHQLINWSVAGIAMVLPLFSPPSALSRLTSIFLGFAPPFLLLSIGYEAVFYSAFSMVLIGWIFVESANLYCSEESGSARRRSLVDGSVFGYEERHLQLSDLRIPLLFVILFNVAFFGTGNFASIASFEISSVYRFITVFSPFLMAGLLIFKLFIPFMLVICAFSAITKIVRIPRLGCYFLVILLSDVMTIHFFFLVRNTGSWMEIGNSISHFGIVSAQVVFVLLLFALTNIYTRDIVVSSRQLTARKVM
jgi:phosphatidylinositol glycan class N